MSQGYFKPGLENRKYDIVLIFIYILVFYWFEKNNIIFPVLYYYVVLKIQNFLFFDFFIKFLYFYACLCTINVKTAKLIGLHFCCENSCEQEKV